MKGFRAKRVNPATGKRSIVFNPHEGYTDMPVEVACGQCIGCRLERSRQWAMRCVHEASSYEDNCFVTLTYAPDHLPEDLGLHIEDFQKFMKRLRKQQPRGKKTARYFHCGEYGEVCKTCGLSKYYCKCSVFIPTKGRPHFHACLFDYDFHDKVFWKTSKTGEKYYISETLNRLWPKGFAILGDVTFESAAYVARYITKKINGEKAEKEETYVKYDPRNYGEAYQIRPEYTSCSKKPSIGTVWYKKFGQEAFRDDFCISRGRKVSVPKAYAKAFEVDQLRDYQLLKARRRLAARKHEDNNTPERLAEREFCQERKAKALKRGLE